MHKERLLHLLERYFQKTISVEEQDELNEMMTDLEVTLPLEDWMKEKWHAYRAGETIPLEDADRYFSNIMVTGDADASAVKEIKPRNRISLLNYYWARIAAVLLIVIAGYILYLVSGKEKEPEHSENLVVDLPRQDVEPGGNFATLTLADGSKVVLDSMSDGLIASQGNARVIKLEDGALKYESGKTVGKIVYNTMSTPVGGTYQLMLPDGTGVWLNASSSITYPTAFAGNERKVSITGEVYFEVTKNTAMPFKVNAGEQVIEVLGTHFNVNAYGDEHTVNTTLAEGKVKVINNNNAVMLKPGQQVQKDKAGNLKLVYNPDLDEILAWKDGVFRFNGTSIETIMRQVGRWYDVNVIYKDKISEQFVAEIPRNVNVSKLLELLELTKQVRFTINNKVITVTR